MRLLRQKKRQTNYSHYVPSGLIAKTEKGFFYIKGEKRFKFVSDKAMETWHLKIVDSTEAYLKDLKICGTIGFRDGTLIKDISNSKIYLISDGKRRHVIDPQIFIDLNYSEDDIILVSAKETQCHAEGDKLNG